MTIFEAVKSGVTPRMAADMIFRKVYFSLLDR